MTEIIRYIPRCTTLEDYAAWLKFPPYPRVGFCGDCTPAFKRKMMDQGRCDHPETRFERDEDGQLTGIVKQDGCGLTFDLFSN